jgi:hypothetical protein
MMLRVLKVATNSAAVVGSTFTGLDKTFFAEQTARTGHGACIFEEKNL